MPLQAGQRLDAAERTVYQVDGCRQTTPWYRVYSARKVFFNYRYHERELYEAGEDEWLDIQIRGLGDSAEAAPEHVGRFAQLLRYEASEVLAAHGGRFPEPLDFIDVVPQGGGDEGNTGGGPLLVFSKLHGQTLGNWTAQFREHLPWKVAVCLEVLEILESLHRTGNVLGGFGPDDFLIDENGRLFCLASDRVIPADRSAELRPYFPPARYPPSYSAPEVTRDDSALDARSDLYGWAALVLAVLVEKRPEPSSTIDPAKGAERSSTLKEFAAALRRIARQSPDALRGLPRGLARRSEGELVEEWMTALRSCLQADPDGRPGSVRELREAVGRQSRKRPLRRLWGQLLGD